MGFEPVTFKGPDAKADLAYRYYEKDRVVLGKRMEDHLRFAVCFWHSFCWPGSDVFGQGTFGRPWHSGANDSAAAAAKRAAAFSLFEKLDVPFYTFHDVDVMAEARDVVGPEHLLGEAVDDLERLQARHGRQNPCGARPICSAIPRYAAGAATNPDPEVFAWAASAGARRAGGGDPSAGRRQLCAVGRTRGL